MTDPDFYLASAEGYHELEEPRRGWRIKRVRTANRDDLLLIRIDPPLIGQRYGLGDRDIDYVLVAPRASGQSLFPINNWPVFVHIARPLIDNPELRDNLHDDEFKSIAWGGTLSD
jgi:hypothetical protein